MTPDTKECASNTVRAETDIGEVDGLYAMDGIDESLPHTDLAPLEQILDGAQFIGLGESIHTSGGYYQAKFRLFRYLVEELGFRVLAIEGRDRGMAFALRRMRQLHCPEARTAVWAHNMHLNRANHHIEQPSGARSMGTFLADQLGDKYRAIALIGRDVETNWSYVDNDARTPVDDPEAVETILGSFDEPYLLYDAQRGELLDPEKPHKMSHWDDEIIVAEQFDALLFLDHSPPMEKAKLG